MATDETSGVHKHTAREAGDLVEGLVPGAPPGLGQRLAALERVLGDGHALYPPLGVGDGLLGVQDVLDLPAAGVGVLERVQVVLPRHALALEHHDAALGVVLEALLVGGPDDLARRQPRLGVVLEVAGELLADALAGGGEAGVLGGLGLGRVAGDRVVPVGVEAADDGAQGEGALAEALLQAGGRDARRVVGRDAVVVGVEGLDEGLVDLVPQQADLVAVLGLLELLGDDGAAKVQVHQAGARQLGGPAGEGRGEGALVVVVAVGGGVVLAADVDDRVALAQQGGVARPHQRRAAVRRQQAQHVHGQGLVGVEVAVVRADGDAAAGLKAFGCAFSHLCEGAEHTTTSCVAGGVFSRFGIGW